jgi:predicted phosphoribosyltransferase
MASMPEGERAAPIPEFFRDRHHAGRVLATLLRRHAGRPELLVLALPRGGVPVGFEVAEALQAPLDVFVVRKLGVPGHEEYAMGAIAAGGVRVLSDEVVRTLRIPAAAVEAVTRAEARELERREKAYRGGLAPLDVRDRIVILVDDGLATGSTMLAAVRALAQMGPARTIVAVPTGAADTCEALRTEADEVVCAMTPANFRAVGLWYANFSQTGDEEVHELLERAREDFEANRHAPHA